nr:rho GTPase-activating protein 20-like [Camelus dromedarius]
MSHLRDKALLTQGSKDFPTPSNLQESFFMEQLPQEKQCHFILKPSRLAVAQQLGDSGQKTFKRRSVINWAFWRGSSTHLDNQPVSPTSPMPGLLFGVSLPDICENDNLPKPILDMLFFLNRKDPSQKGSSDSRPT